MEDVGDYYARKREEHHEALEALKAARCPHCRNGGNYNMETDEYRICLRCGGSGARDGYTYDDLRRLERAVEQAACTGD